MLQDIVRMFFMVLMHKISHNIVAVPPTRLTPIRDRLGHTRRYKELSFTIDCVKNSFYYRSIRDWNKLEGEVANAETVDAFKSSLTRSV